MPESDHKIIDAERALPLAPLAPLDEAHLARAETLAEIAEAALKDLTQPAAGSADLIGGAQYLLDLAQRLLREAVVVERERGASWATIGEHAGSSRQSAHDRWGAAVGAWALTGRHRTGITTGGSSGDVAANLDDWYAELHPDRPHAISTTLASFTDPGARRTAQERREEADRLRAEIQALKTANTAVYNASCEAIGTAGATEKRAAWAANHLDQASAYDRLAAAEAPLGTEHRRSAATQRGIAHDILSSKPVTHGGSDTADAR
ncbi:hypothetical protein [Streptomyces lasiicapitis]|uniref:Uncharacterized protein n=1 Tax=Streptomyces lasiicapitis TaxID=1923961 RepID=A0ABQ2MWE8_9ACTN|nr:hypothetical protein [Streptomyces lasiicapitis]GGO59062.1 hypothetical protein GCM10012286_79800 [Streptomyces lasiicapitis]